MNIKKFFPSLSDDFFLTCFARTNRAFVEKLFRAFFFHPFFVHDIRVIIKNVFFALLRRFCSHFLLALFVRFCKNCFARFFPPFFGHDIRVIIKNVFSHFFPTIFFSNIFCSHYSCVYGKIVVVVVGVVVWW